MIIYYKDEKLTNEAIVDGYFHTGRHWPSIRNSFLKLQIAKNPKPLRWKIHYSKY
jgi:hypothetical protein